MFTNSAIPLIVVICYVAITAIKTTKINSKWYPLISCAIGAIIGAVFFLTVPDLIEAATLTAAIISGAVSGLAATGTNQVFKQLLKKAENGTLVVDENENKTEENKESQGVCKTNDTGGNGGEL
ncbi:MAG: phage holin family protein [Eubacteriales bacterium]